MRRSAIHRTAVLLALAALAGAAVLAARDSVILKLATLAPDGTIWHKALKDMGQEWQDATEGQVQLRIYGGGVAGDESSIVRKMRIGQIDAATLTVIGLTEIDDSFQVLGMPFFYDSYDHLQHILDEIQPTLAKRLDDKGFVFLGWAYAGWMHLFSTEPVRGVEDLRKLKLYTTSGEDKMVQLYQNAGFRPVVLSETDILVGLETGMIEVLPTTPLAALLLQWFRSTPYMLDEGLAPLVGCVVITKRAWNKVPEPMRRGVLASAHLFEERLRREIPDQDRASVDEMKKRGLQVLQLDEKQAAEWHQLASTFAKDVRGTLVPPEIFDQARKARDAYQASKAAGESD